MIECIFGWGKQHGTMRKTKHRGIARVATGFLLNLIASDLIRIPQLIAASAIGGNGSKQAHHDEPEISIATAKLKTEAQKPRTSKFFSKLLVHFGATWEPVRGKKIRDSLALEC
jgi:hypothetical protein